MFKKISLLLATLIIFSCSHVLAAAEHTPIFNGDEKAFVQAYNDVAKKFGLVTFKIPTAPSYSESGVDSFFLEATSDPDKNPLVIMHCKGKEILQCGVVVEDKALAEKNFKAWLMACGLTDKEINISPVFNETETAVSLYCAALKKNIDVETSLAKNDKNEEFYLILITSIQN